MSRIKLIEDERRDRARASSRRWRERHKLEEVERRRKYAHDHPEAIQRYREKDKVSARERARKWYKQNSQKAKTRVTQSYSKYRERILAYSKQYAKDHPDIRRAMKQKRRARQTGNGGSFTDQEWKDLCDRYGNRCLCCARTDVTLSADHVIPLSSGGTSDIGNIQPLCRSCNAKKGSRTIDYRN